MASAEKLQEVAADLNDRQRAYLLAAYEEDQGRERASRRPGGPPASKWRWIEYGPVGAKSLDVSAHWLLRPVLDAAGLVDHGTGATWSALAARGLLTSKHADTGLVDLRTGRPILSLLVRLTTAGRKVARICKGEPARKVASPKHLSLSALRLVAYGQQHPNEIFDVHAPWGMCPLDWLTAIAISRGLVTRGLLSGEAPYRLRITAAGAALDLTTEPNWKPAPATRPSLGELMNL